MIIVTGGTGLLGSHLLLKLVQKGGEVIALRRESSDTGFTKKIFSDAGFSAEFDKIRWETGDLSDYLWLCEMLRDCQTVYHCAAEVSYEKSSRLRMINTNISITSALVDAAIAQNVKCFCFVSSIAALGETDNDEMINETTPWTNSSGVTPYSVSKYKSELEVWRGIAEGLPAVIVNPSVILGSGRWTKDLSSIFPILDKGLNYYPSGTAGFVSVQDVAEVMIRLVESDIRGERFIVSSENVSYRDLLIWAAEGISKTPPQKLLSRGRANHLIAFSSLIRFFGGSAPVTSDLLISLTKELRFDNAKLCSKLDFRYTPVKDVLKVMAKEYKNRQS